MIMDELDNILDEFVNTDEVITQCFLFLQHRLTGHFFQIVSERQRVISTEATPDLSVKERLQAAGLVEGRKGFVYVVHKAGFVARAVSIDRLNAVLVLFSPIPAPTNVTVAYDDADFVLALIECFFTQRDLENKKEELEAQKKQFKREQHILQQRYYKIQDEANRLQRDYTQNLNDEIDRRTREIRKANDRLQRGIDERKRMVAMANKLALKANAANKSKSEFLSKMSHEFRTPLNSIIGFSDMMTETMLDDEQFEYIDFIRTSSRSLLDLVNDILDLSKIESGRQRLENSEFDLIETLGDVENITGFQLIEKGIKLSKSIDSRLGCPVIGECFRLRQVLVNLIGNAIKFMEKGTITLAVALEEESDRQIKVRFSVEDEGIGIPENKVDTIFQPFMQVDSSSTRKYGGSGLGLAISNELVKLMGGERICLKTGEGGSTFFFSLVFPKGTGSVRRAEVRCDGEVVENAIPCKVLLVEDVFQNRKLVTAGLTRRGYPIIIAENGRQAVDIVARERVDVVLMDIQMPVLDGLEATREIRLTNQDVPIIAMTAGAMEGDKKKCFEIGMDGYISKPINIKALDQKIQAVVRQKKGVGAESKAHGQGLCPGANPERPEECPAHPVDPDMLASLADLDIEQALARLDNNEELYRDTLFEFFIAGDGMVSELRDAFEKKEMEVVGRMAHSLKGVAGSISANLLSHAALELETAVRQKEMDRVAPLIDTLERALNQTLVSVRAAIVDSDKKELGDPGSDDTGGSPPVRPVFNGGPDVISSMFCELGRRLKKCDPVGSMEMIALIKKFVDGSALYEEMERLDGLINEFDFDGVLKEMESLMEAFRLSPLSV